MFWSACMITAWLSINCAMPSAGSAMVHQSSGDQSLKSALNAVTRKQRSLDLMGPHEYYEDLRGFKYPSAQDERKFKERQLEANFPLDQEDDDGLVFLPYGIGGQLETPNEELQKLNEKILGKVLMNLENAAEQSKPVTSLFRERERNGGEKRSSLREDNLNYALEDKDLSNRMFRNKYPSFGSETVPEDGLLDVIEKIYSRYPVDEDSEDGGFPLEETSLDYQGGRGSNNRGISKFDIGFENSDDEEGPDVNREQSLLYLLPAVAERRNVNGRYPIGRELKTYRNMASKRFPVAKRSPHPLEMKMQSTDPEVAQSLQALFGTQSTTNQSQVKRDDHHDDHKEDNEQSVSETPKVTMATLAPPKAQKQKENPLKVDKSTKDKPIQVKKKSIDWSQYFGIDRRKKKTTFSARPGSQEQDDEWLLQRYYKRMSDNLMLLNEQSAKEAKRQRMDDDAETPAATGDKKADKLGDIDAKLKNIKDQIMEEALTYPGSGDSADIQEVKNRIMSRLAAAYSVEKMRRALNEFRNNIAAEREAQRRMRSHNNLTENSNNNHQGSFNEKRTKIGAEDEEYQSNVCPELELVKRRCKNILLGMAAHTGAERASNLIIPCVTNHLCNSCEEDVEKCEEKHSAMISKVCSTSSDERLCHEVERYLSLQFYIKPGGKSLPSDCSRESCFRRHYQPLNEQYLVY